MSDAQEHIRSTQQEPSQPDQGPVFERLVSLQAESCWSKEAFELIRPARIERLQCSIDKGLKDDFVDEGYSSPSPTDIETEFFSEVAKYPGKLEVEEPPRTPQIAINDHLLRLPQICVTDADGETENIAPDDDEHGQLWNFARDKIARRMFFIRADRRTQHMESTFYSDLYHLHKRIFAHNGSLLAHAHRDQRTIRSARTESATFSSAYISYVKGDRSKSRSQPLNDSENAASGLADPESIIYESRTSDHITVITPVAPKVLLAVTGSIPSTQDPAPATITQESNVEEDAAEMSSSATSSSSPPAPPSHPPSSDHSGPNGFLVPPKSLLEELGTITEQLSSVLRDEMGRMRWPEGA